MPKISLLPALAIVFVLVGAGCAPQPSVQTSTNATTESTAETAETTDDTAETEDGTGDSSQGTVTITYTDEGYTPSSVTINAGTTVTFVNESSVGMWPASAMHPTHRIYPTTGGCLGSTFDACRRVIPGESWSFQFDIPGHWKLHDHLTPTFFGSVVVE